MGKLIVLNGMSILSLPARKDFKFPLLKQVKFRNRYLGRMAAIYHHGGIEIQTKEISHFAPVIKSDSPIKTSHVKLCYHSSFLYQAQLCYLDKNQCDS